MATVKTNPNTDTTMTLIGQSVRVQGNLSGDEDLHVLGRVDGRIELQRTLIVAQSGIVKAEVNVKNAVISGVVVGNIHASESVEITREGRMVGDIFAPRVIIVDGASFRGTVDMGDIENMPVRKAGSERPRPTTASSSTSSSTRPSYAAKPSTPPAPARATPPSQPPRPAPAPAPVVQAAPPPAPVAPIPAHDDDSADGYVDEDVEGDVDHDGSVDGLDGDAPQAKGLPNKAQKARVIVKRR